MSRLTDKNVIAVCAHCNSWDICKPDDGCFVKEVYKKLKHYEDLEEQGRLIEQKHGQWIKSRKYYDDGYTVIGACSICGLEFQAKLLRQICYCPHCGAKMDEVKE